MTLFLTTPVSYCSPGPEGRVFTFGTGKIELG